ncbi:hypothetical protein H0H81_005044 [Sphagnurus paluster]|uniref:Mediator complex subunit 8 n=1 Tax=Sphagnurus paluster TaxID=117069 RepID=A0A9P7K3Z4_9AGAR|nr:hypothetical protein H0H81_005044 [Sphagnurus paluster]
MSSLFPNPPSASSPPSAPPLAPSLAGLPVSQLESLRFKASQIIDSLHALQRTIEAGHMPVMPAWPDILSKYTILLSQTHSFSTSLAGLGPASAAKPPPGTSAHTHTGPALERIALHPRTAVSDTVLDAELIPLLRNQQTTDVLRLESDTVRRLAAHMPRTRGSLGVLEPPSSKPALPHLPPHIQFAKKPPEYTDVLEECAEIRAAHDQRAERAIRAVLMLRDRFDWRARVEVAVEEPEELDWDPRLGRGGDDETGASGADAVMDEDSEDSSDDDDDDDDGADGAHNENGNGNGNGEDVHMDGGEGEEEEEEEEGSSDADEVQALVDAAVHSPMSMPTLTPQMSMSALAPNPNPNPNPMGTSIPHPQTLTQHAIPVPPSTVAPQNGAAAHPVPNGNTNMNMNMNMNLPGARNHQMHQ